MSKAIYPALVSAAAVVAATGAVKAAPIAIESFGAWGGSLLTAGVSIAIFAGWHAAFDGKITIKARAIGLGAAVVFSAASVLAINSSATAAYQLKEQATQNTEKAEIENHNALQLEKYQAAIDAEKARVDLINSEITKAWQERETKRLELLAQLTEEMRSTSNKKNPAEYSALLEQMTALQVAEPQPAKEKAEVFSAPMLQEFQPQAGNMQKTVTLWVQSLAYEVVAPMLLLLASFYRVRVQPDVKESGYTAIPMYNPTSEMCNPTKNDVCNPTKIKQKVNIEPIKALMSRLIPSDPSNGITASGISEYCGCGVRVARNARNKAVKIGELVQVGEGKAARFVYSEDAETFGVVKGANVVSITSRKTK